MLWSWNRGQIVTMLVDRYRPCPARTSIPTTKTVSGQPSFEVTNSFRTLIPCCRLKFWHHCLRQKLLFFCKQSLANHHLYIPLWGNGNAHSGIKCQTSVRIGKTKQQRSNHSCNLVLFKLPGSFRCNSTLTEHQWQAGLIYYPIGRSYGNL